MPKSKNKKAQKNHSLFKQAQKHIPGGVNSPVRAFGAVGGTPILIAGGRGAYLIDVEKKRYIDYMLSWGPLILGHADKDVVEAVRKAAQKGMSFGASTPSEIDLARLIKSFFPSIDLLRLVSSGTEAAMSAIRLSRGYTGKDKILKFEGCYHGHADYLLIEAGSGSSTLGVPTSPGIPKAFAQKTLTLPFNDIKALQRAFSAHGKDLAAVIIEPIAGNMGVIPAEGKFLKQLRHLCTKHKTVLIFDEVMSGFRAHLKGAQAHYGIKPDLTVLGKVIGGGMPVGAYGGCARIMKHIAPCGKIYQAGTLSGNPVATAAGLATLSKLKTGPFFGVAEKSCITLVSEMRKIIHKYQLPLSINQIGTMFTLFFLAEPPRDYNRAKKASAKMFARFFHHMLDGGIYWPPSLYEAAFTSACHTQKEINKTLGVFNRFCRTL